MKNIRTCPDREMLKASLQLNTMLKGDLKGGKMIPRRNVEKTLLKFFNAVFEKDIEGVETEDKLGWGEDKRKFERQWRDAAERCKRAAIICFEDEMMSKPICIEFIISYDGQIRQLCKAYNSSWDSFPPIDFWELPYTNSCEIYNVQSVGDMPKLVLGLDKEGYAIETMRLGKGGYKGGEEPKEWKEIFDTPTKPTLP